MTNQQMLEFVRSIPVWYFYILFIGMFAMQLWILKVLYFDEPRWAKNTLAKARKIATSQWEVQEKEIRSAHRGEKPWVLLTLKHKLWSQRIALAVRPYHPDIQRFQELEKLNVLEFEFTEKPLECALESELCAYLRLKDVLSEL